MVWEAGNGWKRVRGCEFVSQPGSRNPHALAITIKNMKLTGLLLAAPLAAIALHQAATAATVIPVTIAYGHNNRDNFGGNITDVYNGSGMNGYDWTNGQANNYVAAPPTWPAGEGDPSTWTITSSQYRDEWQSDAILDATTSINSKIGWIIFNLGSPTVGLDEMYLWNGRQIGTNTMKDFNLYYSTSPVVPANQGPTNTTSVDYDFGVAAWTKVNSSSVLTLADNNNATPQGVYSLGGVTAQYVAIEILNKHAAGPYATNTRVGFGEVGFTAIPEPSAALLGGIGALILLRRRR